MSVPVRANQIRAHKNVRGEINYYIVVAAPGTESPKHVIWFRSADKGHPMYLVQNLVGKETWNMEEDEVVVENMNEMYGALEAAHKGVELPIHGSLQAQILDIYKINDPDDRIIPAIQLYRRIAGGGLKEAREAVEALEIKFGLVR